MCEYYGFPALRKLEDKRNSESPLSAPPPNPRLTGFSFCFGGVGWEAFLAIRDRQAAAARLHDKDAGHLTADEKAAGVAIYRNASSGARRRPRRLAERLHHPTLESFGSRISTVLLLSLIALLIGMALGGILSA
jgi:hypothetical protein